MAFTSLLNIFFPNRGLNCLWQQCKKKKKDVTHIRLLLTSLQNGIEEPWQRVPSIVAVFAAEASFILLDSSHDHYATLSRHLMNLSKMSMKVCV